MYLSGWTTLPLQALNQALNQLSIGHTALLALNWLLSDVMPALQNHILTAGEVVQNDRLETNSHQQEESLVAIAFYTAHLKNRGLTNHVWSLDNEMLLIKNLIKLIKQELQHYSV